MNKIANEQYKSNEKLMIDVFLKLLETKEVSKITVREICEKTNLNRTTFYNHFLDVYDLLDKVDERHTNQMALIFKNGHSKSQRYNLKLILNYMKDNQPFYRASLNASNANIFNRLKNGFITVIERDITKHHTKSNKDILQYQSIYLANGMLSTIAYWLNEECKLNIEDLLDVLVKYYNDELNSK